MHYIKDIFEKKNTQHAHDKLIRYSRGVFTGPLLKVKFSKNEIKLNTSFHIVDEIYLMIANWIKNEKVEIEGLISWNKDLTDKFSKVGLKYLKVSKLRGIFKYTLKNEVEFLEFINIFSKFHLLVSFKTKDGISVTTKLAFPKPSKPIIANFCKISLPIEFKELILKEFLFDVNIPKNLKSVLISNKILIDDIILPPIEDFEIARRDAKKIGKIIREVEVNTDEKIISEVKFNI